MTKSNSSIVRLFGGAGTPQDLRPTIDTIGGPIYSGTDHAVRYTVAKTYSDALTGLSRTLDSMLFDKAEVLGQIATALESTPEADTAIRATLIDLSEAMQGRTSNQSGMNFRDAGQAFTTHVQYLRNHAERVRFGLETLLISAPRPPCPLAVPAPTRQQLGTWFRQFGGGQ
jgi:hypothetical protein